MVLLPLFAYAWKQLGLLGCRRLHFPAHEKLLSRGRWGCVWARRRGRKQDAKGAPSKSCALLSPRRWFRQGRAAPPRCLPLAAKQLQQHTGPDRHQRLTSRFEGIRKTYNSTFAAKLVTSAEFLRGVMGQREKREEKKWGDEERTAGDQARTKGGYAKDNSMEDSPSFWKLKIQYSFIFFSMPKLKHFPSWHVSHPCGTVTNISHWLSRCG